MNQTIGDILELAVIVGHQTTVPEAIAAMASQNSDRIYITDPDGRINRVICDFTLLKAQVRGELQTVTLSSLASPIQEVLNPAQPLSQAAILFRSGLKSEIPVFDGPQFLGVVRRKRLIRELLVEKICVKVAESPDEKNETCDRKSTAQALTSLRNQEARKTG